MIAKHPWVTDLGLGRTFFEHLFLDQSVASSVVHFELGRWYGEHVKMMIGTGLEQKKFSNSLDTLSFSYIKPQWSIVYDTRDIFWNPGRGFYFLNFFYMMLDRTNEEKPAFSDWIPVG
jgi:hypothetical protein